VIATSQATSELVATQQPTAELVAYDHRPPRPLVEVLDVWRSYVAGRALPRPAVPVVVELPKHLLN
jgi:hypothetical protein